MCLAKNLLLKISLMEDGIKGSLEAKGILYRASNMGDLVDGWAYNINLGRVEHLQSNPGVAWGPHTKPAEAQPVVKTLNKQ